MTTPKLHLTRRDDSLRVMDSYYATFQSDTLWNTINNDSLYLFIRIPILHELARREDPGIMDYCDRMLKGDIEEWFVGLKVLGSLGTPEAFARLVSLYQEEHPHKRTYIIHQVARTVKKKSQVTAFKKMILSIAACGQLDVTGWTDLAIETLQSVCKRLDIVVIGDIPMAKKQKRKPKKRVKTMAS